MIRQRNIDPESEVGTETFSVFVTDTISIGSDILPIAMVDVAKLELLELGVAIDGTMTGTTLKARLETLATEGFNGTGVLVKESADAADVGASAEWGLERFDPPIDIPLDYTNASGGLNKSGFKANIGHAKLRLVAGGDATVYEAWIWCKLRIHKIKDL